MNTVQNTDTQVLNFLTEYARIRRDEHSGWNGDPVANAESFVRRKRRESPALAEYLADAMSVDPERYSDAIGLPPGALARIATLLVSVSC
jgi:hypothetical protein